MPDPAMEIAIVNADLASNVVTLVYDLAACELPGDRLQRADQIKDIIADISRRLESLIKAQPQKGNV